MPLLYEEVHIVNCPRVAEMGYKLIKPFLGERIREKIKFHTTNALLHSHVDKSVLSNALGGTLDESDYNQVCLITIYKIIVVSKIGFGDLDLKKGVDHDLKLEKGEVWNKI